MKRLLQAFTLVPSLIFIACGNDSPVAKIIVTDQKMPLVEWPDSAYVTGLDSILKLEPLKKQDSALANINMNVFEAPVFRLPGSAPKKEIKTNQGARSNLKTAPSKIVDNSAEVFADKFAKALSKLQSDPSNASLYKTVEVADGDDLFKLLRRNYGAGVQNLPRFFVLSALQSVNAGVRLEHLNSGDKVRIPRL